MNKSQLQKDIDERVQNLLDFANSEAEKCFIRQIAYGHRTLQGEWEVINEPKQIEGRKHE